MIEKIKKEIQRQLQESEERLSHIKARGFVAPNEEQLIVHLKGLLSFINILEVKEVDLKYESLTWKDIGTIDQLLWDLSGEHSGKSDNEGYYKAVLSRFKAQKG